MIEIKRRLHDGIYRSSGGGEVRTLRQWTNSPRNLVQACKLLPLIHQESVECYGNVGCGSCWIEIDGVELDDFEMSSINYTRESRAYERSWGVRLPTATQYAATLLQRLADPREDAA